MRLVRNSIFILLCTLFSWSPLVRYASAADQADLGKRAQDSAKAFADIMSDPPNAIPKSVLQAAKCVAVMPSMVQIAVGVGASHGKGLVTCRTQAGWSAPAPIDMSGGSWGAQLGGQAVDLVMIVTNDEGMQRLLSSQMKFGTEASVAAGPLSRHAGVSQDPSMNAEILTYSRARGVFVGTNLNGASLTQDDDDTKALYGDTLSFSDILQGKTRNPEAPNRS